MPRVLNRSSSTRGGPQRRAAGAVRAVRRPSGPLALLAQLAGRPYPVMAGFLGTILVAADPVEVVVGPGVWDALEISADGAPAPLADAWIGYVGYPGQTSPSVVARYRTIAQFFLDGQCLIWGHGERARELARAAARYVPTHASCERADTPPTSSLPAADYAGRVAAVVDRIAAGDYSQVNLVQRLRRIGPAHRSPLPSACGPPQGRPPTAPTPPAPAACWFRRRPSACWRSMTVWPPARRSRARPRPDPDPPLPRARKTDPSTS